MTELSSPHTGVASGSGPVAQKGWRRAYAPLLPLAALAVAQVGATAGLAALLPTQFDKPAILLSLIVLAAGLMPALLRPSWDSSRVGSFTVLLACMIWQMEAAQVANLPSFAHFAAVLPHPRASLSLANTALLVPLLVHIIARFPRRSAVPDRALIGLYVGFGALAAAMIAGPPGLRVPLLTLLAGGAYAGLALVGWLLVRAIRDPQPEGARQIVQARLLFVSLLLMTAPLLALPVADLLAFRIPLSVFLAAQATFPLTITYAIMRHDLFGIDAALRRALGYAGASLGFVAVYLGLTMGLTLVLREWAAHTPQLVTALGILGAAVAFARVQGLATRLITQTFYPERLSFQRDLAALQAALSGVVRRAEAVTLLAETLPARLGAGWARLQLLPEPPPALPDGPHWGTRLTVGGQILGAFWLGPRRTGLAYAPEEQERLRALTQQAALALAYAENYEALIALNEELEARVEARSQQLLAHQRELAAVAERQRLARDLHDSLKQSLFSLGLNLHAAARLIEGEPARARRLIVQQAEQVVQAQSDLSDLLGELRTPTAATADLVAALHREVAHLEAQHRFTVALSAPPFLELDLATCRELTAVAREGLHNALKHSGATGARLTLGGDADEVLLVIADEGRGFEPAAGATGYGLRGMGERARGLGGSFEVHAARGKGTQLWVRIPLHRPFAS